ncbi:hypothetical protein CHS0354_032554 [Potamilus streckersoni]|uniref:Galectin n=1 Tax=Potamilus streckersoni TaxID=2493646 RepID=A0AAE0SPY1_9BIVA|nr:hypothetical protein CHS0354_032554 [Potamilus streckersoni]
MSGTVCYPPTPYVGSISLQDGSKISIQGVPEYHQTQFVIALQSGSNIIQRSEIPFWFNPRFNENQVVRNTKTGNSWGLEERHGGFPFQQGQMFDVEILVRSKKYKISVNGQHFGKYRHRTPTTAVTHLVVEGGIKIHNIHFENPYLFLVAAGGYPPPPVPMMYPETPIYNPPTPFVQNIPGGIYPGKMIFISGVPSLNPTRFSIYLQNGMSFEPSQVGLLVDARISFHSDRNVLVRNHREDNKWGREEREVWHFPFVPNVPFDMIISIEDHQYKVAVNNQHLLEFHHRIKSLSSIDTLRIDGSVALTQIRFQ